MVLKFNLQEGGWTFAFLRTVASVHQQLRWRGELPSTLFRWRSLASDEVCQNHRSQLDALLPIFFNRWLLMTAGRVSAGSMLRSLPCAGGHQAY